MTRATPTMRRRDAISFQLLQKQSTCRACGTLMRIGEAYLHGVRVDDAAQGLVDDCGVVVPICVRCVQRIAALSETASEVKAPMKQSKRKL